MEVKYREVKYSTKAKSGKVYTYTKLRPIKELKGKWRISKSGKSYLYYYQRKPYPDGLAPSSDINKVNCLKRDNYSCRNCGAKENLDAHHKDGRSYWRVKGTANNHLENLVTLCGACHQRLHNGDINKTDNLIAYHTEHPEMSYAALGRMFTLSRERVRQIVDKYGT